MNRTPGNFDVFTKVSGDWEAVKTGQLWALLKK